MLNSELLKRIEDLMRHKEVVLGDDSWRRKLPPVPGWYFIKTNTPVEVLAILPSSVSKYHYNIPEKTKASLALEKLGGRIIPESKSGYFVYSGEAKNLKARAREHFRGHEKTYCLCLEKYKALESYKWEFHYSEFRPELYPNETKLLRILGEQLWRAKHGWPILCGK